MIKKNSTLKCPECEKTMYKIKENVKKGDKMNSKQITRGDGKDVKPYNLIQCCHCKTCYSPTFVGVESNWTDPLIIEVG